MLLTRLKKVFYEILSLKSRPHNLFLYVVFYVNTLISKLTKILNFGFTKFASMRHPQHIPSSLNIFSGTQRESTASKSTAQQQTCPIVSQEQLALAWFPTYGDGGQHPGTQVQ